jgi:hypothetical protein
VIRRRDAHGTTQRLLRSGRVIAIMVATVLDRPGVAHRGSFITDGITQLAICYTAD